MVDRIEKTVVLKAPIERVWKALTDHEEFGAWFRVKLEQPFVVGGVNTGHITSEGYEHMKWWSQTEVMEAPRLFVFTWSHSEDPTDERMLATAPRTRVEFRLEELAGATRLVVVESGFEALPEGRRATVMRENEGGWQAQIRNIQTYVEK